MSLNKRVWLTVSSILVLVLFVANTLTVNFSQKESNEYFNREVQTLQSIWVSRLQAVEKTERSVATLIEKDDLTQRFYFDDRSRENVKLYSAFSRYVVDLLDVFPDVSEISVLFPNGEEEVRVALGVSNNSEMVDSKVFRSFMNSTAKETTTIEYHEDFEQAALVYYRKLDVIAEKVSTTAQLNLKNPVLRISAPLKNVFSRRENSGDTYVRPILVNDANSIIYPGDDIGLAVKVLGVLDRSWDTYEIDSQWYLSRQPWKNNLSIISIIDTSKMAIIANQILLVSSASIIGLGLVLVLVVSLFFRHMVIAPLEQFADFVNSKAQEPPKQLKSRSDEIGFLVDAVTEMREHLMQKNQALSDQVYTDVLTGLPNRNALPRILTARAEEANQQGKDFALLFLDLDGFKQVNDAYGHAMGDKLLTKVSERISVHLRANDSICRLPGESFTSAASLVRLGGDEFTVILPSIQGRDNAKDVATRIIATFDKPFDIDDIDVYVGSSIGIALYPDDTSSLDELVKFADTAMYQAKTRGKMQAVMYDSSMVEAEENTLKMKHIIRHALDNDEVEAWFQPKVNPLSHKVEGFEALARINSKLYGFHTPNIFVSVAEQTNLIDQVTMRCLESVCRQFLKLREVCHQDFKMSLNLSPKQIRSDKLFTKMTTLVRAYGVPEEFIDFEFVETSIMQDEDQGRERLNKLRSLGFKTSLDDFGVGYSSLSYLKEFKFDTLKIDRTFFRDVASNASTKMVLQSILEMARNLKMTVVAEGIETAEQLQFVMENKVDLVQGYLYSKPLRESEVMEFLVFFDLTDKARLIAT